MIQRRLFSPSFRLLSSFPKLRGSCHGDACRAVSSMPEPCRSSPLSDDESCDFDWDSLGFGLMPTDYMYIMKCSKDEKFERGQTSRYGNIELSPSAGVLNYGQGLFEGLKAYRKKDGGFLLFRPDQNALRMKTGAERMCMPSPSIEQFVDAVKKITIANKRWVPPLGKGSLYIRPLLIGTGPVLGLAPAPEYTFLIYASPVRNYFKEGSAPLNLYVENEFVRASRGGTGGVKTISNYAPVLKAITRAKSQGFSDVLYLDSVNKRDLEEVSSCNIFIVKGNVISTPATHGTILPGVTRKSIIDIARDRGYTVVISSLIRNLAARILTFKRFSIVFGFPTAIHTFPSYHNGNVNLIQVEERAINVEELFDAREVFCTGTAVGVAPVGSITCMDRRIEYQTGADTTCQELYSTLVGIQTGTIKDKMGWTVEIS